MSEEKDKVNTSQDTPNIEDLMPSDIYSFVKIFMSTLANQTWIYLGLTFDPKTKAIKKDLEQAKIAIDCFEFLFKRIKEKLSSEETSVFLEILSNLQLNFIEKSKEPTQEQSATTESL